MPLPTLNAYTEFGDYKNDLKMALSKLKLAPVPYRLIKEFEFSKSKGPLLVVGKPSDGLLKELQGQKLKAVGYCRVADVKVKDKTVEVIEFQVDKGSLAPNDLTQSLKAVGLDKPARIVDDVSGTPMKADQGPDRAALKKRAAALRQRLEKATNPPPLLGQLLAALETQIDKDDDPETAVDKVEEAFVKLLSGRAPMTAEQVDQHLKKNPNAAATDKADSMGGTDVDAALDGVLGKITKFSDLFDKMLADPNGALLAGKQIQALHTALEALKRQPMPKEAQAAEKRRKSLEAAIQQLKALAGRLPKLNAQQMEAYIQSRRDHLAYDKGNKKVVPQEGEVGADTEMALGGLTRAEGAEVEFKPGEFSPYGRRGRSVEEEEAKRQELLKAGLEKPSEPGKAKAPPDWPMPDQFDVFGLTPDVAKKVMCAHARRKFTGLKALVDDDVLWEALRVLTGPGPVQVAPMPNPVQVDPSVIFTSYLTDGETSSKTRSHFQSLEEHFNKGQKGGQKPTVVPLDARGMARWPLLLAHMKSEVKRRFPNHMHLIVWRE